MTDNENVDLAAFSMDVTNEDGAPISEETTSQPDSQVEEKQPEVPETPAEKPQDKPTEQSEEPENANLVEDEAGKRYVPEDRFKQVYGKMRALERQMKQGQPATLQTNAELPHAPLPKAIAKRDPNVLRLETEMLRTTMPQFDQSSPDYSPELDELGMKIFESNPTMSLLDAGREALRIAQGLSRKAAEARIESRTMKAVQSDSGITGNTSAHREAPVDPGKMSLREMEDYLKKTGQW